MFCAIGSERIILPFGFERCVSAAEALQYLQWSIVVILTVFILMLAVATVGRLHVWHLQKKNRNQELVIAALSAKLHK